MPSPPRRRRRPRPGADPIQPVDPPPPISVGLPYEQVAFAHNSERQFARLLDFYRVRWEYEPHTFVLERGEDGSTTWAFSPDFYLPDHGRYIEVTTLNQKLVTRKHRKLRKLRELQPLIDIALLYQRDYLELLVKYGLEAPEQLAQTGDEVQIAAEPLGLLGLGTLHAPLDELDSVDPHAPWTDVGWERPAAG